jgi:ribosomal-protein-alanine N-acetyltransferase
MIGFFKGGIAKPPIVRLDNGPIYLRPPRLRDFKRWSRLREESREFLTPWEPAWPADALTRRAFMRRLRRQNAEWRRDEGYSFLVFLNADQQLVGGIGLSNVRRGVAQMASLGYWIGASFSRQGMMSLAVRTMVLFGFAQLGLHRIEAACLPTNAASRGLLTKSGFREEGYARAYLRIDGAWRDHVLYALLREDVEPLSG